MADASCSAAASPSAHLPLTLGTATNPHAPLTFHLSSSLFRRCAPYDSPHLHHFFEKRQKSHYLVGFRRFSNTRVFLKIPYMSVSFLMLCDMLCDMFCYMNLCFFFSHFLVNTQIFAARRRNAKLTRRGVYEMMGMFRSGGETSRGRCRDEKRGFSVF